MSRLPEGSLANRIYTALTHTGIAFAITLGATGLTYGATLLGLVRGVSLYMLAGAGGGFAFGFYVGREEAEPDRFTNLGSVLDMLGALVGVLTGWLTAQLLGWIVL